MTEPGNIELLRLGFEVFQRQGPAAVLELGDPEIECFGGPGVEPAGLYRGREAALRWAEEWFEAWEQFRMERRNSSS
jgi:hypothetical protein